MAKTCPRCNNTFIFQDKHFYKDKSRADGLTSICKECKSKEEKYYRDIRKSNKEKITKECESKSCNNVFTTTREDKLFCCKKCSNLQNYHNRCEKGYRIKRNFELRFKRSKINAEQSHKKWSEKDISIMVEMKRNGAKFKEIAEKLNRSVFACTLKYGKILKEKKGK